MINTRKFGIEIEFVNANRETLAQKLVANGIPCFYEGYNHTTRGHWKIVTDATVRGGYELVSPPLQGEAGLLEVKKVLAINTIFSVDINSIKNILRTPGNEDMYLNAKETQIWTW